jgi:hypothetical protein
LITGTGETWKAANMALHVELRGLPGGDTLYGLLKRHKHISGRKPGRRGGREALSREQLRRRANQLWDEGLSLAELARQLGLADEEAEELLG